MKKELSQLINSIKSRRENLHAASEAVIKQTIILPLLANLGWDIYNSDEVFPEYSTGSQKVDYSLRNEKQNKVFVEAKKVREDLATHQEQLLQYAFKAGIEVAVLTNGLSWWFYLPLNPGDWKDRKCCSIDIIHQEESEIIKNFINFFAKENVVHGKSLEYLKSAKEIYKQKQNEIEEKLKIAEETNFKIQNDARSYNIEDYKEKGYIDVDDNIFVKKIVDGCNLFGYNYKGFQRGFVRHPIERERYLWFPKLHQKDWNNRIIDGGKTIIEESKKKGHKWAEEFLTYLEKFGVGVERITFTGEIDSSGRFGYKFRGVFLLDKEATQREGKGVYRRVGTRVKTYARI